MKFTQRFARLTPIFSGCLAIILAISASSQDRSKKPRQETLLNGLKVLMWSDPTAKDVSVKIRVHAGAAFDPQGKEGVMRLLADNIFPNAAAREFFSEDLNGALAVETTYDYIQISASSDPAQLLVMLDTLAAAVTNPSIDKPTTSLLREALLAELTPLETDTAYVADQAAAKRMFGTFPYGRPIYGSTVSVKKIDFADLIDAKLRFLTADNATMTIVGNFNHSRAWQATRRYFGAWLKSDKRVPSTFRQPDAPATERLTIASPKANESAFRFLARSPARSSGDFASAKVFEHLLRSRLADRSPESLKVRLDEHVLPGALTITMHAARNDLLAKIMNDSITQAEFDIAKSAAIAEWAKRYTDTLWLDVDTFKTAGMNAEIAALDKISFADLHAFADKLRKAENVSVLVHTPSK